MAFSGPVSGSSICNNCTGLTSADVKTLVAANDRGWRELSSKDRRLIGMLRASLDKAQTDAAGLKEKQTITDAALRGFFATLGRENPSLESLPQALGQIAGGFLAARAGTAADPTDTPEIRDLKAQARAALDANRRAEADALLARIADAQRTAASPALTQLATTYAQRGDLAMSELKYAVAAGFFEQAAAIDPVPDRADDYRVQQSNALSNLGTERGDNLALQRAIEIKRLLLTHRSREKNPDLWASMENDLAIDLQTLGVRQTDSALLAEAAAAYKETEKVFTRDRSPLQWAETQHNMGSIFTSLGEREAGTQHYEDAVKAFNAALLERTEQRTPLPWAMTQNNLGDVLLRLGERRTGLEELQAAVKAFEAAERVETPQRYPLLWAKAESNRGAALIRLGQREAGLEHLQAAVAAFRSALAVSTREVAPMAWAANQNNLGNALVSLDLKQGGADHLADAIAAYDAALLENTREHDEVRWAQTQTDKGIAYETLGHRNHDPAAFKRALAAYHAALSVFTEPDFTPQIALLNAAVDRCTAALALLAPTHAADGKP